MFIVIITLCSLGFDNKIISSLNYIYLLLEANDFNMKKFLLILLLAIAPIITFSQTLTPVNSIVCWGDSVTLSLSGSNGDTINWQYEVGASSWIPIAGTDSTFNTGPITQWYAYRAGVTSMGITTYSNPVFISVAATPVINLINYSGTSITVNWYPTGSGNYTVIWTGAGVGVIANATSPITLNGLVPNTPICIEVVLNSFFSCVSVLSDTLCYSPVCAFTLSETHIDATCNNSNGSIDLSLTPPIPATYIWSNGATTEDLSNITSGNYSVTVIDTSSCINYLNATVVNSNAPSLTATHTNSTCYTANGSIDLTVTGGVSPYNYLWSNGATTEDLLNLVGGNYFVTVTDQNSCDNVLLVYVIDYSYTYYAFITAVAPNCNNTGSLTANMNGGQSPYSFLWSNGATSQTLSGVPSGTYHLTVTDNGGCQTTTANYFIPSIYYQNIIQGKIYNDLNGNCIFDAGELPSQGVYLEAHDSNYNYTAYGTTDVNGDYSIAVPDSGYYVIENYAYSSCGTYSSCFAGIIFFPSTCDTISGADYSFIGPGSYDLYVFPYCYPSNPGFDKEYDIEVYDNNFPSFADTVILTFVYDTSLTYNGSIWSSPPVDDTVNHTLTWIITDLNSFSGFVDCEMYVPSYLPLTYLLQSNFSVSPTANDCYMANNQIQFAEPVTSSLDPNSKQVSTSGNLTAADSILTYTIHFQNTGNDTTHFVILKDTLSQYLNPASVENITASAPFDFTISGSGILTWIFNPLFLPDSASNEAMSKGFVQFKVKVKPNLPNGALIENSASIYFDYNIPVITNTTTNSFISGIHEINSVNEVTVFPNPAEIQLTIQSGKMNMISIDIADVLGRNIYIEKLNQKTSTINLKSFPSGVYFIKALMQDGNVQVKKFVKE